MAQIVGDPAQVINFNFKEDLASNIMNKLLFNVINDGVLYYDIEFGTDYVKINRISLLIKPFNKNDIVVKVDTTEPFILSVDNPASTKIIARYEWKEEEDNYVDFMITADVQENDVIIGELIFNGSGEVVDIDYSNQTIPNANMFYEGMSISDAHTIDCFEPGNDSGNLALNNGNLNIDLVAQKIAGHLLSEFAINNGDLQVNLNAEKISGYIKDELALKDGILREVNADLLDNKNSDEFAQCTNGLQDECEHTTTHNYDTDIQDGAYYKKIKNLTADRKIQTDTIQDNSLSTAIYDLVERREYNTVSSNGQVIKPTYSTSYNPSEIKIYAGTQSITTRSTVNIDISGGGFNEFVYIFTGQVGMNTVKNASLTSFQVYGYTLYGFQDTGICSDCDCKSTGADCHLITDPSSTGHYVYVQSFKNSETVTLYYFAIGR